MHLSFCDAAEFVGGNAFMESEESIFVAFWRVEVGVGVRACLEKGISGVGILSCGVGWMFVCITLAFRLAFYSM